MRETTGFATMQEQVRAAEAELEEARQELSAARVGANVAAGSGASDGELRRLVRRQKEAQERVEVCALRVEALAERARAAERMALRKAEIEAIRETGDRLEGWYAERGRASREADALGQRLVERLDELTAIEREIGALVPSRVWREVTHLLALPRMSQAYWKWGLNRYVENMRHWDARHHAGLSEQPLVAVEAEIERLRSEATERAA